MAEAIDYTMRTRDLRPAHVSAHGRFGAVSLLPHRLLSVHAMAVFTTLDRAYHAVRDELLARRTPQGHWVGELAGSALSTATAISAMCIVAQMTRRPVMDRASPGEENLPITGPDRERIARGLEYLLAEQNHDGGWGDTDRSFSNISTTMLAVAALQITGMRTLEVQAALERGRQYIERAGGTEALRQRYGKDKTFVVPILTNGALAGIASWDDVSPLPFELACLPHSWYRLARMPVVSYAIPALVAMGVARSVHSPSSNPLVRRLRQRVRGRAIEIARSMQPASGGFLEATPLTAFVAMALASCGWVNHPIVGDALRFLRASQRENGSWPIDTNLACWVTTLSINALHTAGEDAPHEAILPWLLGCQHREEHPFTHAAPGGWGWSDLSGAVPDADDTAGALLALAVYHEQLTRQRQYDQLGQIEESAGWGLAWLASLQNRNGGWPTFCRGWGQLPFDRSGVDLTAHALRAMAAWQGIIAGAQSRGHRCHRRLNEWASRRQANASVARGFRFLAQHQRHDGSWLPLWFGNQHLPDESNPVYGTARCLLAYRDWNRMDDPAAQGGLRWLAGHQCSNGGWGACRENAQDPPTASSAVSREHPSVEETAVALEALLTAPPDEGHLTPVIERGVRWLCDAVTAGQHHTATPIGFYFAKLWYYESLYPLVFVTAALGAARRRYARGEYAANEGSHPDGAWTATAAGEDRQG